MKNLVLLFWLLNGVSPIITLLTPIPELNCLVCQASEHAICDSEGHDCSHHQQQSCNSTKKPTPKDGGASLGHKCVQPEMKSFLVESKYLPLIFASLQSPRIQIFPFYIDSYFPISSFEDLIEHPPPTLS